MRSIKIFTSLYQIYRSATQILKQEEEEKMTWKTSSGNGKRNKNVPQFDNPLLVEIKGHAFKDLLLCGVNNGDGGGGGALHLHHAHHSLLRLQAASS